MRSLGSFMKRARYYSGARSGRAGIILLDSHPFAGGIHELQKHRRHRGPGVLDRGARPGGRFRHAAAGQPQPHHRLGGVEGAEGKGRHQHARAAHGRRQRDHPDGQPRRVDHGHRQCAGDGDGDEGGETGGRAPARGSAPAADRLLRAQGQPLSHHHRHEERPGGARLLGDAHDRSPHARHPRHRRLDRARRKSGSRAKRGARRRRFRLGRLRHVLLRFRRPEGTRDRLEHPAARAGDRRARHGRGAQDHAVWLSHLGAAGADLHRRRKTDEGLQLRQSAAHQRQGARRHGLQDPRHAREEQERSRRGAAGAARLFRRQRLQALRHALSPRRAQVLQGTQHPGETARVSEAAIAAEAARPRAGAAALATDLLQAALLIAIVGWVLDVPRRLFGVSFYTEQLLAVCLGIGLALSFVARRDRAPHWLEWFAAVASLAICAYITIRYEPLSYELAMLPLEGVVGSALLILMVLIATWRSAGATLVGIILVLAAWVFIGPHLPADFRTLSVSPQRLLVYLGLDVNGMIGAILAVAILIVVPVTLMGQVLARTGGSAYFADLAMSAMGHFRGGAAKIAVVGSALFGMISGAAVSNVMAVGILTIPPIARSGFSPTRAAAIESVGSTGGPLMPPEMGAPPFLIPEILEVE